MINHRIVLASRPAAEASADNFRFEEAPLPTLHDGQVLVRHHYLSLDPYMRGRMNDAKSYAVPQKLDAVMGGGTVGEVIESRHAAYAAGDRVVGMGGWQEYSVVDASQPGSLRKVDTTHVPLSAYLGAVGMPGVTAWVGLNHVIAAKAGETIVVDAASGAVGSAVGQLAKAHGCRAVGIAGGADKCAYVVDELGFDACIDYKQHRDFNSLAAALDAAAPGGVDGLFENVGGLIFETVLSRMNAFGRIALCGMIAGYNGGEMALSNPRVLLTQRLKLQGFIVSEHMPLWPQALAELGGLVASGKLKYRESIASGLAAAPEAFLGLLKGSNFGKQTGEAGLNWTWSRFAELGVDNLYDALVLRSRVFVVEQNCVFLDADGADRASWHLLGRDDAGVLQACLRVVDPGVKYAEPSIGRVISAPESRGSGTGRMLMAEGVARCIAAWPGRAIRIGAQAHLENFYRSFGFVRAGENYIEDDIPHVEMVRPA